MPNSEAIRQELQELASTIQKTRSAIASIKPKDITAAHIPQATDELDAVVGATEEATNKIMDVCDEITTFAKQFPAPQSEQLIGFTTRIFEACNFQDITGQRISKVVNALKHIDTKVDALLAALGGSPYNADDVAAAPEAPIDPDKALLNGPQLPKNAFDQSEIDKLMEGF